VITGTHAIVHAEDAERARGFFSDVLGLPSVDAGGGWLIFKMPPAELGVHPAGRPSHELYLMCDDVDVTVADG
jgi:catechol 2,3-dioxygenase-like lactoylglutathione lyase family enzyme